MGLGPPFCSSCFVAMVFLNAIVGCEIAIFAYFCNISFVFCIVLHVYALCVACCLCTMRCTMHGAWYWYACHASHHHHVFIIMFIMFIIDHHVHR